ncbi:GNAT family acetyltransferase [Cellulosimicrobium marinum]|uniref:GNAT family acetyltransferase n=1 Tax=Cellulosimicrobium marinum TaxID=1638992 RepID=UPI001E3E9DB5|nr:GNAT family acetyltransferase [Cellulosimicrobium marinum]MCB7136714.1 GNAT family acetyltransferase [Cellulosimicrobium marinum]
MTASAARPAPLEIADVADGDVEAVVALWRACGLTRPWNDPYRDVADARLGETSTVLVGRVAASDPGVPDAAPAPDGAPRPGEVVASVMVGVDGHRGWLYYLAVDPRVQGSGHGRAMVVAAEAWLAAAGARAVRLMVRTTNDAVQGFYRTLGYSDQECTVLGRRLDDA